MRYRAEIDGLRALAVVPVILFHASSSLVPGGFIGVDVFFVISGFLITGILLREIDAGNFSILNFYERRCRRILPALYTVIAFTLPFAYLWSFPNQYEQTRDSVWATLLFYSNIEFWQQSGYFATASEFKPYLHTWSLSIEEQFYVFFPIGLLLISRLAPKLILPAIAVAALASLSLSEWGSRAAQSANFFLLPTRAWELLAGSIAAIVSFRHAPTPNRLAANLGLLGIIASFAFVGQEIRFPSLWAVPAVAGTSMFLVFGNDPKSLAYRLLTWRPIVFTGLISYSLYLWHQPIFALARIRAATPLTPIDFTLLIALTAVCAILTYYLVETPLRRKGKASWTRSKVVLPGLLAVGLVGLAASQSQNKETFYARATDAERLYIDTVAYRSSDAYREQFRPDECFIQNGRQTYDAEMCLNLSETKPNVLIMGDSHAAHFFAALPALYPDLHFSFAAAAQCSPLLPFKGVDYCQAVHKRALEAIRGRKKFDAIILSGKWGPRKPIDDLRRTLTDFTQHTDHLVVLGQSAQFERAVSEILFRAERNNDRDSDTLLAKYRVHEVNETDGAFRLTTEEAGGKYVDLAGLMCTEDRCLSHAPDGIPLLFDVDHFTASGAKEIARLLADKNALGLDRLTPP